MVPTPSNWLDFVVAMAWPAVALIAMFVLRRPLVTVLNRIASRATKLSAFNIAIEIDDLPKAATLSGPLLEDFRYQAPTPAGGSAPPAIVKLFSASEDIISLQIDL